MKDNRKLVAILTVLFLLLPVTSSVAQEVLPRDNSLATYHTFPRYNIAESHPVRLIGYALHPIGWVAREGLFRPLSYFVSSSEVRRSVFGYREPYDYREPECFSPDSAVPDCRTLIPFDYDSAGEEELVEADPAMGKVERHVYFPDVNFDFDVRKLNDLGQGRTRQVAQLLKESPGVHVVLEGHADYLGTDDYNNKLGMDRAEAVRQELVSLGVSSEQVSTVTFGKSKPIFGEEADWARAVNRRVEVHVGPKPAS